ncbi:MAG: DNA polymerase Y family protein, partial [Sphingomonadales bacterium]
QRVGQLQPHQSHIPERACRRISGLGGRASWDQAGGFPGRRPFRLFSRPEIINVMAEIPDGPPLSFRWRRMLVRVTRAEGPERITPEWWQGEGSFDGSVRDYYHLEDSEGCRFWVYRDGFFGEPGPGHGPRWYMHGLFA